MIIPYQGRVPKIAIDAFVVPTAVLIGQQAMLAAGSVATEGMTIPPRALAAGIPAKVRKELDGSSTHWVSVVAAHYRELASQHREVVGALNPGHEKR